MDLVLGKTLGGLGADLRVEFWVELGGVWVEFGLDWQCWPARNLTNLYLNFGHPF